MPWTCQYCGKVGDRQGVDAAKLNLSEGGRFCQREGLATLKGQIACCNCLLATGWKIEDYYEGACISCIRGSKRKLPPNSARRAEAKQWEEQLKTITNNKKSTPAVSDASTIKQKPEVEIIKIFDFDHCLFKTPQRPEWWPSHGYQEMMESLLPPLVPLSCEEDWWNVEMVREAKLAFEDPKTYSVLVSFRGDAFKTRIHSLLEQHKIKFNETRFRPLTPFLSSLESGGTASVGGKDRDAALEQLRRHFAASIQNISGPMDRHTFLHAGNLLDMCTKALEVHLFVGKHRKDGVVSIVDNIKTALSVHVHEVPHEPHTGGIPSPEFLDLLEKRKEVNVHITNRLAARPFWTCVESARTEPRIVAVVREPGPTPMKKSDQLRSLPQGEHVFQPTTAMPAPRFQPRATGPVHHGRRRRFFGLASLQRAAPPCRKHWGPKDPAPSAVSQMQWSLEAVATNTKHFANQRGGSKAPRGRVVASLHRGMYSNLSAWDEDDYYDEEYDEEYYEAWSENDEDEEYSRCGDQEMESCSVSDSNSNAGDEAVPNEWLQRCPVQPQVVVGDDVHSKSPMDETASGDVLVCDGESSGDESFECMSHQSERTSHQSCCWEMLSEPDAQSVSSDWYERDLDVMSFASESSQDDTDGSFSSEDWMCARCTFVNSCAARECDMCSSTRPSEATAATESREYLSHDVLPIATAPPATLVHPEESAPVDVVNAGNHAADHLKPQAASNDAADHLEPQAAAVGPEVEACAGPVSALPPAGQDGASSQESSPKRAIEDPSLAAAASHPAVDSNDGWQTVAPRRQQKKKPPTRPAIVFISPALRNSTRSEHGGYLPT